MYEIRSELALDRTKVNNTTDTKSLPIGSTTKKKFKPPVLNSWKSHQLLHRRIFIFIISVWSHWEKLIIEPTHPGGIKGIALVFHLYKKKFGRPDWCSEEWWHNQQMLESLPWMLGCSRILLKSSVCIYLWQHASCLYVCVPCTYVYFGF